MDKARREALKKIEQSSRYDQRRACEHLLDMLTEIVDALDALTAAEQAKEEAETRNAALQRRLEAAERELTEAAVDDGAGIGDDQKREPSQVPSRADGETYCTPESAAATIAKARRTMLWIVASVPQAKDHPKQHELNWRRMRKRAAAWLADQNEIEAVATTEEGGG